MLRGNTDLGRSPVASRRPFLPHICLIAPAVYNPNACETVGMMCERRACCINPRENSKKRAYPRSQLTSHPHPSSFSLANTPRPRLSICIVYRFHIRAQESHTFSVLLSPIAAHASLQAWRLAKTKDGSQPPPRAIAIPRLAPRLPHPCWLPAVRIRHRRPPRRPLHIPQAPICA